MTAILQRKFQDRLVEAMDLIRNYEIDYLELGVFGSYARKEFSGTSDIDICIVVEEKPPRNVSGALREECELIGVDIVFVTKEYFDTSQDRFARKLRKDYQRYEEEKSNGDKND